MHPRSITARPWKMVVGRRSFPIGKVTFQGQTAKLPRGYCESWSNIPWRFSSVTPWRTTAVRLQHRRETPERFEHVATEWNILSGNIQPHRLVLHENICKIEKFLKKIMHTPTNVFFVILPFWKGFHKNKHYSSTSWEDVLVGSEDEHFFKKTTVFFSFKLFELFGRSKAPFLKPIQMEWLFGGEVSVNQLSEIKTYSSPEFFPQNLLQVNLYFERFNPWNRRLNKLGLRMLFGIKIGIKQ